MAHVALPSTVRNPSTRSAPVPAALSPRDVTIRWAASGVPILPCPGLPLPAVFDSTRIYVVPGIAPDVLAETVWLFLSGVHGFRGDAAEKVAIILPIAEERARSLQYLKPQV